MWPLLFLEVEVPRAVSAAPTHPLAGERTLPSAPALMTPPPTQTATVTHRKTEATGSVSVLSMGDVKPSKGKLF